MISSGADSKLFEGVVRELLESGLSVRFQARGASMSPVICDGDIVRVTPVIVSKLRKDDIVLAKTHYGFRLHRLVMADHARDVFITRGDCGQENDPALDGAQILGLAQAKEVRIGRKVVQARLQGVVGQALQCTARAQVIANKIMKACVRRKFSDKGSFRTGTLGLLLCVATLILVRPATAQVAVDSESNNYGTLGGFGATTLTISHTTGTGTNRLMLVGVSMNIANGNTAAVTSVTNGTTALTLLGAHNDAGGTRRVEMWYLLAPASGTATVTVTVNIPGFVNEGVAAGVMTFTGVDQTVPLGAFNSADGTASDCTGGTTGCSSLDVPGVVNGMIMDTLATSENQTVTINGPQTSEWNDSSGNTSTTGVRGTGSTRTGAPSVPISETFSGTSNWSLGAVSINPSSADIGVTTSVSAVPFGQNSTYNITVFNNGYSAAIGTTLTDTFASSNLSLVSVTPSSGTTCTSGTTITCTLPTPFASGATATITVIVSTTEPGFYPNTATVADSSSGPPDPNTGNNTFVALAPVVNVLCGPSPITAGGTLTGVVNTYYPGAASVSAGATSIPLGTAVGSGTIAAGTELLVIQMQDASINYADTVAYGNGSTGAGFTAINNAGNYEFVTATGPINSSGSVPILGAGVNNGLVFGYNAIAASSTKGASTYQVVLVPQYTSATLGAVTAAAWNGSTGGILALDIANTLNLGSATVSVNGLGFRGGAGLQMSGGGGSNTDYEVASPASYTPTTTGSTSDGQAGWDASKGEGVAGTPMWVESGGTYLQTTTTIGYPSPTSGADGSMARGAPGNAGGGGTDGDPQTASPGGNDQNAGGGGGGNGGSGGFGGDSWSTNLSVGGEGGGAFPATIDRLAMGGGGGAGTRNNSDGDNQASGGSAGGGIVFIRAYSFTGTATITANGANAYNGTSNDAGGGGGAGGTIVMLAANGGESGLTLQANGGSGGDAWESETYSLSNRHGPGGGGGGGVVFVSNTPASASSVTGGADGVTLNTPSVAYGSTPGNTGTIVATATMAQVTGLQSSEVCSRLPDLSITKSHGGGNLTRGTTATYTLQATNINADATSGLVTINDTLPLGVTPTSASGPTGWSCSVSGQTVSCTTSSALATGTNYTITVSANVSQSAPATITNTGMIGGGGDISPLNDTATDVANVVSTADLAVTDAASPNPVAAGSNITYTQVVTNNGPSAADNATLVTSVPAGTTLVSMVAPTGWSCSTSGGGGTGNIVCIDVDMAGGTAATFTMTVKVNTGTANGTVVTNNVAVSSSVADPNSSNNTASASVVVGTTANAEMVVTNTASPNPVNPGSDITYTQTATNVGSVAATNPTLTESIPANTTFVSISAPTGTTCTTPAVGGTGTISCTAASAPAGTSGTIVVVVQVAAAAANGTTITDTATVNATNQGLGANSAIATDTVESSTQANLTLSTVGTPNSVFAGNNITYTQTITNNGPAAATGAVFTEAIPANTTFQSVSAPAGWTCTTPAVGATTGNVVCNGPSSFASGSNANIVVVVGVPATDTAGTITATSSLTATNASSSSTTVSTPVTVACNLGVTNSGTPSPVTAGGTITYTQVVTNSGVSNCSTATFTETTPTNTTFQSISAPTGWSCTGFPTQCTDSSVAPGTSGTFTVVYKVNTGATGSITDTATVASASRDTNPSNNSATVVTGIASSTQADLSVTNSGSPNPVSAGSNITYTQSVTNNGPASASTISFTDPIPANTTVVSLTGPSGWTCSATSTPPACTIATLAANTTANFTYVVTVSGTAAAGSTIAQTDSVTSSTSDPNSTNNSATANVGVADSAGLSITNVANPVPVAAGNNIIYSQVVTNSGPSVASGASVTETIPPNTTFQSITYPTGWSCTTPAVNGTGTITCTNPSLAKGSGTFTVVLKVTAGTAAGTAINDTATVSSNTSDPNLANNTATAADVVATATESDLVVTNSASPTSVAAGSNVTYTQSVTNDGPAAATGASFTQTTPPNTTFQSITPPAGWTCGTVPAVGGTGTITCTDPGTIAVNGTANFTLVLQVNSSTPSGTSITETDNATASNVVPNLTSNSANATVIVANANSADMAITKTGSPNPVTQGTPLTYTLTVTNNGPATATTVTVTDTLPSSLTYLSSTVTPSTQGTCSEAGGTVTCQLGTMTNTATATISILTIPEQSGVISNTATVTADQTDPNSSNNSATWNETVMAPTGITLQSFSAHSGKDKNGASRVILTWKTGGEAHNLGFNLYREQGESRVRVNSSVIAGSALLMKGALAKHAGRSYAWIDSSAEAASSSYWLEDVDVNGTHTMHGPVSVQAGTDAGSEMSATETRMLSQLSQAPPAVPIEQSHIIEPVLPQPAPTQSQAQKQFELAAHPAVKILVQREGWYRITQPQLIAAGLDPNVDPSLLHLYAEAVEQPIEVTGATDGRGGFGPQAAINFYGTGIDTVYSGTRVYWLVAGQSAGTRIAQLPVSSGSNQPPQNYLATVELQQHVIYFSALLTQNGNNFYGPLVTPTPVEQVLSVPHLDSKSSQPARLDIALQGIIVAFPHDVQVELNGTTVANLKFTGQALGRVNVNLPPGLLQEGTNTVTLTAQNGEYDTSLVQSVRLTYPHKYVADSNGLRFTGRAGDEITVSGFASAPLVFDITDPGYLVQLTPQLIGSNGKYQIALQVPWTTTNPDAPARHTLLAIGNDRIASTKAEANRPSHWHAAQAGADIAMVSYGAYAGLLSRLVHAHEAEGKTSVVVPVGELYDEFNFGEKTPLAIRKFLQTAKQNWRTAPTYLLLNGRASFDPRDYLGFGNLDLVPTQFVPAGSLMTASDDWFSDFTDSGMPTIATGRLPVASEDDANTVVGKIVSYGDNSTNGAWTSNALMVADRNDSENFTQDAQAVQSQLPKSMQATDVFTAMVGTATARQEIIAGINSGQLLVNYTGHGSEEQWSGSDIFDTNTVATLTNGSQLPVFLIMDCLNGYFQDVYAQPLGVVLLLAPNGGAVATFASTGLNQPAPQTQLDKLVVQNALSGLRPTLGDTILKAKSQINDLNVRKTFVLFGDPAMRFKQPAARTSH
jgi:uncharacterized repeat protein (TIGR01451 family)